MKAMMLTKHKLGDLLEVTRGASLSGEYFATQGDYVRLTCGNFDYQNNCFKSNSSKDNLYYTGNFNQEYLMEKGDIITPLTEQAIGLLGSTAWVPESGKYIQSQDVAKITPNEKLLDKKFCYYLISSKVVKQQLSAAAQQTKIRHTSPDKIKDCTVWIPSLEEQTKVGQFLYDIDSKIALNRQINDNLEAMARQLYDYWFVQFDFPDENGKPYKSNDGKMVWNEKLNQAIPEGWNVLSVNEVANSVRGVTYEKKDLVDAKEGILVLRGNNIQDNHLVYDGNVAYVPSKLISKEQHIGPHDIIMTMSSGSKEHVGKSVMFQFGSENTYGAFLTKFSARPNCAYLLYHVFNSVYFKTMIKSFAIGTGINNLTNGTFDNIFTILPSQKTLLLFDKIQEKIYKEIGTLQNNTVKLTKQRNELLPLLMNGQVSVNYHLSEC